MSDDKHAALKGAERAADPVRVKDDGVAKVKRKVARRRKPPTEAERAEFPGLTANACSDACNAGRCVVSHAAYCAHPRKGGLHPNELVDAKAVARYGRARDLLRK